MEVRNRTASRTVEQWAEDILAHMRKHPGALFSPRDAMLGVKGPAARQASRGGASSARAAMVLLASQGKLEAVEQRPLGSPYGRPSVFYRVRGT